MGKQAMGNIAFNQLNRMDTLMYLLARPSIFRVSMLKPPSTTLPKMIISLKRRPDIIYVSMASHPKQHHSTWQFHQIKA
jgi:hypothetical protein